MDLNWTTQINNLSSKVGLLLHTINTNSLTLEAAVYMINGHLIPNLEYRMKHMQIDEETLKIWDDKVTHTISQKVTPGYPTSKHALTALTGLKLPSQAYTTCRSTDLMDQLNNPYESGTTARIRFRRDWETLQHMLPDKMINLQ